MSKLVINIDKDSITDFLDIILSVLLIKMIINSHGDFTAGNNSWWDVVSGFFFIMVSTNSLRKVAKKLIKRIED